MTSLEIADLVEARHDSARRTIERLAERGVITLPPLVEKPTNGRPSLVYVFAGEQGKRDSYVVVAQLSPEFTARLVDRWQELESRAAPLDRQVRHSPHVEIAREQRLTMTHNLRIAKMLGLAGNQAVLSANRATAATTGIDTLGLMGITHIDAPQNEPLLTPTDIGKRLDPPASAQSVNQTLCGLGLQHAFRDGKGHVYYELTDAGNGAGGVMQDTGKKHGSGTPIRQLRWASSIVEVLSRELTSA